MLSVALAPTRVDIAPADPAKDDESDSLQRVSFSKVPISRCAHAFSALAARCIASGVALWLSRNAVAHRASSCSRLRPNPDAAENFPGILGPQSMSKAGVAPPRPRFTRTKARRKIRKFSASISLNSRHQSALANHRDKSSCRSARSHFFLYRHVSFHRLAQHKLCIRRQIRRDRLICCEEVRCVDPRIRVILHTRDAVREWRSAVRESLGPYGCVRLPLRHSGLTRIKA